MRKVILSLIVLPFCVMCNAQKINIVNPTVEMQSNPQALHTAQPRFSWQYQVAAGKGKAGSGISDVVQTSYRIIVSSTYKKAKRGIGDLWDTTVASSDMLYIPYKGKTLHSRQKVYWAVHTNVIYEEPVKQKVIDKVYIINRKRQKTMSAKVMCRILPSVCFRPKTGVHGSSIAHLIFLAVSLFPPIGMPNG